MNDQDKTREQLIDELVELRQRVAEQNAPLARSQQAEADQRQINKREKALLQSVMNGARNSHLVYLDLDFNFVRVNEAYAKTCGYTPEEMIGKNHFVLYPNKEYEAIFARVRETGVGAEFHDKPFVFPDPPERGVTYWDWTLTPVQDDTSKVVGLVFSLVEITERKRAEAELRASQERFELVVGGAGVGIWDWDVRTGKVYYSPRWKMLFGYEENEIGDGVDDWARLLHPEERDRIIKFQGDFLAGTSSNITAEYRLRHKDGSYRWIVEHGVVVRDEQGKAIRLVGSHGDITDRKLAEEELKAEQRAIRRMLVASDHERRLLTYEIHDGPVQQLVGALLLFQSPTLQKVWQSPETEAVYRDGMAALLHAQLELRRVMNSLRTPVLEAFGVVDAIEDVAGQLRLAPGALEIECHDDVQFKRLEPTLENFLFRIAQEAMTNACRHGKSEKIRVTLTQVGDYVTLEVRDWGIGFDQDTVQENRFGLEGIRERCRILGGELSIKSKLGEGTVVRAKFPVIEAPGEE